MALTIPGMKTTFKSNIGDYDATAQDDIGCLYYAENAVYKYVKFSGTTATVVGDVVCYVAADATMTIVDAANTALGAGVATASNSVTGTAYYGWIQIRGIATLSTALAGSPSVGDDLTTDGASTPAVTTITDVDSQRVATTVIVSSKTVACNFPF